MQWVLWMVAVAVLGLAAVAGAGRLGELPGTVTDTPRRHLPATGEITGDWLRNLQFAVVPRGYSMEQVDELLDRLAEQLDGAAYRGDASPGPADAGDGSAGSPAVGDPPVPASPEGPPADYERPPAGGAGFGRDDH